jgi:hypothetical protein
MSLESDAKLKVLRDDAFFQILLWALAGFRAGQNIFLVFIAVFFGVSEGLLNS